MQSRCAWKIFYEKHLHRADRFDVKKYPSIVFELAENSRRIG